ncbi:Cyclic nucleotide-binding domain protein [Roseivivax jejudonensis]|uniref:Cyclic nucleotide-binding domain protein n=1 Tax=Roseivivax jejudonensis TaxID=1529041 RepID=A0A1X6YVB5_9RHOB|nr:cyclic nucleotide-binding domain-containing protein [Roseivivax jejudonensis]SLN32552.1 Cyclic nucleotide-binding domain protein [Roseivivax jejudonensis]
MTQTLSPFAADILGIVGAVIYLGAYAALQLGLIRGNGYLYASLNLVAAGFVLAGMSHRFYPAAAIIQVVIIAISVIGMARLLILSRAIRFSPEEQQMHAAKFPELSRIAARRLFDSGLWLDAEAGTTLMREGETHGVLIYLASGAADIYSAGKHVGTVEDGNFLGEMTVLQNEPATATVVLARDADYFRIEGAKLRRLGARDPEVRVQIENALSRDTRLKLVSANSRLGRGSPVDPS